MRPPGVILIGKNRAEATLAMAALRCAGARIVSSRADLIVLVGAHALPARTRAGTLPTVAIVDARHKRKALASGVDAAYARPAKWSAYRQLVQRLLATWAAPRRARRSKSAARAPR